MKYICLLLLLLANFAFALEPASDGLIIHLKADSISGLSDGQDVVYWTDSAGSDSVNGSVLSANHGFPQYISSNINGMSAVRFIRAENDLLASDTWTLPDPSAGLTVFIVCTGGTSGNVERAAQIGSASGIASKLIAIDTTSGATGSGCRYNNGYALVQGGANPVVSGQYHIGVRQMAQNGSHSSLFYSVNDLEAEAVNANNPGNIISFDSAGNHISLGNGMSPDNAYYPDDYDGYIAEILVYNKQLSFSEMSDTGKYLSQKYALPFTTAAIQVEQSDDTTFVSENGTVDNFTVSLSSNPGSDSVEISFIDMLSPAQVSIVPDHIVLDSSNWQNPVQVEVRAVEDNYLERPVHDTKIKLQVSAPVSSAYYGIQLNDIPVNIEDNECGSHGFNFADINLDCVVDVHDFALFVMDWLECSNPDPDCQL